MRASESQCLAGRSSSVRTGADTDLKVSGSACFAGSVLAAVAPSAQDDEVGGVGGVHAVRPPPVDVVHNETVPGAAALATMPGSVKRRARCPRRGALRRDRQRPRRRLSADLEVSDKADCGPSCPWFGT
jgi:hypothetical protein